MQSLFEIFGNLKRKLRKLVNLTHFICNNKKIRTVQRITKWCEVRGKVLIIKLKRSLRDLTRRWQWNASRIRK